MTKADLLQAQVTIRNMLDSTKLGLDEGERLSAIRTIHTLGSIKSDG